MLENHYRMHDEIAGLINKYYGGRLVSAKQTQMDFIIKFTPLSPDPVEKMLARSRTIFVQSGRHATSKRNEEEAGKVVRTLETIKRVYGSSFTGETVGVVTPWRAQIARIKSMIRDPEIREKVMVDTVERFQGSEREIILVSLAVYHQNQVPSMTSADLEDKVDRKLLVTLSRAKDHLVIFGYDTALEVSRYYRDLLERIRANNGFIEYQEGMQIFR